MVSDDVIVQVRSWPRHGEDNELEFALLLDLLINLSFTVAINFGIEHSVAVCLFSRFISTERSPLSVCCVPCITPSAMLQVGQIS